MLRQPLHAARRVVPEVPDQATGQRRQAGAPRRVQPGGGVLQRLQRVVGVVVGPMPVQTA